MSNTSQTTFVDNRNKNKAVDPAEWLAQREADQTVIDDVLPSGLPVKLRKPSLKRLIASGRIPMPLLAQLEENADPKTGKLEITAVEVMERWDELEELLNVMFVEAMHDPKIVTGDEPWDLKKGTIHLSVFNDMLEDKIHVVSFAFQGVKTFGKFLEG